MQISYEILSVYKIPFKMTITLIVSGSLEMGKQTVTHPQFKDEIYKNLDEMADVCAVLL